MPNYQVREEITIKQSKSKIIEFLADFKNWPTWSPWLIQEPDCPLTFTETQKDIGSGYEWDGKLVGAGSMRLTHMTESTLTMGLNFKRPFKSSAKVTFDFRQSNDGCIVGWAMNGHVPWYLFFLKNLFKNMISMDYNRGLLMLKSQLETGKVNSTLEIIGQRAQDKMHYIALQGKASLKELGPMMQQHFSDFDRYLQEHNVAVTDAPFAIYDTMDMATTVSQFSTCFPIENPIDVAPPFICKTLNACDTYVVKHTGAYTFMGNAWATAFSAARFNKIKNKRKPMGIERYLNRPDSTAEDNLETEIILLIK